MKFIIAEGNIGNNFTKEMTEKVIELLQQRGWDIEYGAGRNQLTEESEAGREEAIQDAFGNDFMECIAIVEDQHMDSGPSD